MNPEDQIIDIRDILANEVFGDDKLARIEKVIGESATAEEILESYDDGYATGYEASRHDIFYPMLGWGMVCGVAGYIIALAV